MKILMIVLIIFALYMYNRYKMSKVGDLVIQGPKSKHIDEFPLMLFEQENFGGATLPLSKNEHTKMFEIIRFNDLLSDNNIQTNRSYNSIKVLKPVTINIEKTTKDGKVSVDVAIEESILDFQNFITRSSELQTELKLQDTVEFSISLHIV